MVFAKAGHARWSGRTSGHLPLCRLRRPENERMQLGVSGANRTPRNVHTKLADSFFLFFGVTATAHIQLRHPAA
jgi:hypothetical protein